MVDQRMIEILKIINDKSKDREIKWVLVRRQSSALQKIKIRPSAPHSGYISQSASALVACNRREE
jgi:hypothetical protein